MKRWMLMMALVVAAGLLRADDLTPTVKVADPIKLKGLKGIGLGHMPGLTPPRIAAFGLIVNEPDTVVFRYWITEKISWEGQLAMDFSTEPSSTTQTTSTTAFGLGTGIKWNFKRPTETSMAQFLVGLSYASLGHKNEDGSTDTTGTFNIYVGPGFEAFLPFWRSLSVEGSLRLRVSSIQTRNDRQSGAGQSSSYVGFAGDGFTPLSLAMHYYF